MTGSLGTMNKRLNGVVLDDLADVAAAERALEVLEARMVGWCRKPYVSREAINGLSEEIRLIRAGLATTRKWLLQVEERDGKVVPMRREASG